MTGQANRFSLSSEAGKELIREHFRDLWPRTPQDYRIVAAAKSVNGIDVLAILPTGAGETAILTTFVLILDHMRLNPERFPEEPIVAIYSTNCIKEEQVRDKPT